jgi:hypothetical protein
VSCLGLSVGLLRGVYESGSAVHLVDEHAMRRWAAESIAGSDRFLAVVVLEAQGKRMYLVRDMKVLSGVAVRSRSSAVLVFLGLRSTVLITALKSLPKVQSVGESNFTGSSHLFLCPTTALDDGPQNRPYPNPVCPDILFVRSCSLLRR